MVSTGKYCLNEKRVFFTVNDISRIMKVPIANKCKLKCFYYIGLLNSLCVYIPISLSLLLLANHLNSCLYISILSCLPQNVNPLFTTTCNNKRDIFIAFYDLEIHVHVFYIFYYSRLRRKYSHCALTLKYHSLEDLYEYDNEYP